MRAIPTVERSERASLSAMLIIAARDRPDLVEYFRWGFAGVGQVRVVLDRRQGRRRDRVESRDADRRRGPDRRVCRVSSAELRARGFVIVPPAPVVQVRGLPREHVREVRLLPAPRLPAPTVPRTVETSPAAGAATRSDGPAPAAVPAVPVTPPPVPTTPPSDPVAPPAVPVAPAAALIPARPAPAVDGVPPTRPPAVESPPSVVADSRPSVVVPGADGVVADAGRRPGSGTGATNGDHATAQAELDTRTHPLTAQLLARAVVIFEKDGTRRPGAIEPDGSRSWRCGHCETGLVTPGPAEFLPATGRSCGVCRARIVQSEVVHDRRGPPSLWRRVLTWPRGERAG